jgi:hypothetical protein
VGYIYSGGTFTGNVAWDEMGTGEGGATFITTNTNYTGADITATQVQDGTDLPASLKSNPPWTYTPGKLPILDGLEGQSNALPAHLE